MTTKRRYLDYLHALATQTYDRCLAFCGKTQIACCAVVATLVSCSTTKHVPDDDYLFTGLTKIEYTNHGDDGEHLIATQEEIDAALATQPNGALFGSSYHRTPFPYGLWIWNATQGSHGRLKKWLNRTFGKAPVLMSQVNPALRASVASSVLRKNGYLHGNVTYDEVAQRNPKTMKLGYTVSMDSLFRVDSMSYVGFPQAMKQLIDSTADEAYLYKGVPFSVANLDAERTRIATLMRNQGFYYYQSSYASYLADTFEVANRAQLRLQMADSVPQEVLRPWYIGRTEVNLRRSRMERLDSVLDRRFLRLSFSGKRPPIRPGVVLRDLKLRPRQRYSYDLYQESMQKLNATGMFSSVDVQFTPRDYDTLDLKLDCIFDKPYDFYIETNLINRTIGRMGPEARIGVTRRNAFRGGEKLDINLHGAYEWQTNADNSDMNSYQYGADVAIEFPRIVFPRLTKTRKHRGRARRYFSTPWTIAKLSSDVVRRPKYYKMHIVSGEWTYRWQHSATSRHELSPFILKYQYMNSHTEAFDSLLMINPYLTTTMSDYFIPKMRYTYTYQSPSTLRNPIRWETSVEESGNLTALYDVVIQGNGWRQRDKTLFKNPYSQFFKIETDLTKTWTLDLKTQLVGHVNYGLLWSYGNSTSAPFSEMFYAGGANSVRAFSVRSIGPGAFRGIPGNRQFSYMMQNGDTKLVMNLELRRQLFGNLYGALFLDAGNVWSSEDWTLAVEDGDSEDVVTFVESWNDFFSNTNFKLDQFLKEMAVGTGVGLRYDLDFLILRLDWGFALHAPYDTGKSGYFNLRRFKDMHTLHFAIGYPF